jgi:hypothetical protein
MNKTQRLRNAGDGLMAGLVLAGYRGPWRWSNLEWELPFYRVWRQWPPLARDPSLFPALKVGGIRETSEGRELLAALKSTSPFHRYDREALPAKPGGWTPEQFVEHHTQGASADEWKALATAFLVEMAK